jgi:Uma2 family endonuclease
MKRKYTYLRLASRRFSRNLDIADERLNYGDYYDLPEDGHRYEIIGGELFNSPAPFIRHQQILRNIGDSLSPYCRQRSHGMLLYAPTDVILTNYDIVQPDILWVSDARKKIITKRNIQGAPDLVVEITSIHTKREDLVLKKKLYGRHGVSEYWLVDPDRNSLDVFKRRGRGLRHAASFGRRESFETPMFPGLVIELKKVFA